MEILSSSSAAVKVDPEEVDACIDALAFSLGQLKTSEEVACPLEEYAQYTRAILDRHEAWAATADTKIATCVAYHIAKDPIDVPWALFICTPAYRGARQIRCVAISTLFEVRVMKVHRNPAPHTMDEAHRALSDLVGKWIDGPEAPSYTPVEGDTPVGEPISATTNVFWPLVDAGYTLCQDIADETVREEAETMLRCAQDHHVAQSRALL